MKKWIITILVVVALAALGATTQKWLPPFLTFLDTNKDTIQTLSDFAQLLLWLSAGIFLVINFWEPSVLNLDHHSKGREGKDMTNLSEPNSQTNPLHPLRVFLCHASKDKADVRALCRRLRAIGVEPWLDEENLLPGQNWEAEIGRAVRHSDVVVVCLSPHAVSKTGFIQREIKLALDVADEQPEGSIFLIPLKLIESDVPERLRPYQWVNYYEEHGYERLLRALRERARSLGRILP